MYGIRANPHYSLDPCSLFLCAFWAFIVILIFLSLKSTAEIAENAEKS